MTAARPSPVLILGAEPRIAVSIARSLGRHGLPVDVAALSRTDLRLSSKAIRKFSYLPDSRDKGPDFIAALTRLIRSNQYSLLIPCSDTALTEVVKYYGRLESIVKICGPRPEIIKRVLDKDHTLTLAQHCGIPVPATYHIAGMSALRELRQTLRYPMIAKPLSKRKASSFKIRYFRSFAEIEHAFSHDPQFGANTLFQEYCIGEGVGIGTLIHDGKPVAIYQHRRLKEYPSTGGVSVLAISESPEPLLVEYSIRLLKEMDWDGPALVEYRFNRQVKTATLMEINGRYWGSLASAIHSGVDFPLYEWQTAHEQELRVPVRYRTGLRVRWIAGDVRRLHEILTRPFSDGTAHPARGKEVFRFISDFRPSVRTMLWSRADPLPAVIEIFDVIKKCLLQDAKLLVNRIMPPRLNTRLTTFRRLGGLEKIVYLFSETQRFFRAPELKLNPISEKPTQILFLCHGNIIRSPMAEALFKQKASEAGLKNFRVMSAGVYAKQDAEADPRSIEVAPEFGVRLNEHRARPLTDDLIESADAIFVMDALNESGLLRRYPASWRKVHMLGAFFGTHHSSNGEIPDPYEGGIEDVRRCYDRLQSGIHHLVMHLAGK